MLIAHSSLVFDFENKNEKLKSTGMNRINRMKNFRIPQKTGFWFLSPSSCVSLLNRF
jgi:hypothetical protein